MIIQRLLGVYFLETSCSCGLLNGKCKNQHNLLYNRHNPTKNALEKWTKLRFGRHTISDNHKMTSLSLLLPYKPPGRYHLVLMKWVFVRHGWGSKELRPIPFQPIEGLMVALTMPCHNKAQGSYFLKFHYTRGQAGVLGTVRSENQTVTSIQPIHRELQTLLCLTLAA